MGDQQVFAAQSEKQKMHCLPTLNIAFPALVLESTPVLLCHAAVAVAAALEAQTWPVTAAAATAGDISPASVSLLMVSDWIIVAKRTRASNATRRGSALLVELGLRTHPGAGGITPTTTRIEPATT